MPLSHVHNSTLALFAHSGFFLLTMLLLPSRLLFLQSFVFWVKQQLGRDTWIAFCRDNSFAQPTIPLFVNLNFLFCSVNVRKLF